MRRFSRVGKHGLRDPKYAFCYLSWPPSLRCEQPMRARKRIFYFSLVSGYMHELYSLGQAVDVWTMMIHSRLILYSPLDEALTVNMAHCYTHNLWMWARYPNVFFSTNHHFLASGSTTQTIWWTYIPLVQSWQRERGSLDVLQVYTDALKLPKALYNADIQQHLSRHHDIRLVNWIMMAIRCDLTLTLMYICVYLNCM